MGHEKKTKSFLFICLSCVCVGLAEGLMGGEEGVIKEERKGELKFVLDILSLTC